MKRGLPALPVFAVLLGCATAFPAPPALGEASSGIAIAVSLSPPVSPLGAFDRSPEIVYFVRDYGQERFAFEDVVVSRYSRGGRFYALGIEPGVYLPIACAYQVSADLDSLNSKTEKAGFALPGKSSYTTFFSRSMANAARASVEPGQLFVMGAYQVDMSLNFARADEFQKNNQSMLAPDLEDFSIRSYLSGKFLYTGTPRDTLLLPAEKALLLREITRDLAGTEWTRFEVRASGL